MGAKHIALMGVKEIAIMVAGVIIVGVVVMFLVGSDGILKMMDEIWKFIWDDNIKKWFEAASRTT